MQERVLLTPHQVEQIVQLRQDLLDKINTLVEERAATFAKLQVRAHPMLMPLPGFSPARLGLGKLRVGLATVQVIVVCSAGV